MRKAIDNLGEYKRDPEEEYFMLAVLSHKMLHNEKYDDASYAYELSAGRLFKAVRDEGMPFHRWYNWLELRFENYRKDFIKKIEE